MDDRRNDRVINIEHAEMLNRIIAIEQGQSKMEDSHMRTSMTVVRLETMVQNFVNIVERFENILERTNNTLNGLNVTIIKINGKTEDNTIRIDEHGKAIENVKERIKTVDEKGKIDLLQIIKDNFLKFVLGGSVVAGATILIDKILDLYLKFMK